MITMSPLPMAPPFRLTDQRVRGGAVSVLIGLGPYAHRTVSAMWEGPGRRRVLRRVLRRVVSVTAGLLVMVGTASILGLFAGPAVADDAGPSLTEVPVRIHGHDTSWPPVLVFCALVVVFGGIFAAVLFMRRVRQSLRSGNGSRAR
jgi:hypothetical protein